MNDDKTRDILVGWLEAIGEATKGAKDFVLEQAPEVVRDVVALGRAEMTVQLVLAAAGIVMAQWVARLCCRWFDQAKVDGAQEDQLAGYATAFIGVCLFGIAAVVVFLDGIHEFCAAWFAPRVYVIEYVAELIGTTKGS